MNDFRSKQGPPDDPRDIGGIFSGGLRYAWLGEELPKLKVDPHFHISGQDLMRGTLRDSPLGLLQPFSIALPGVAPQWRRKTLMK